MYDANTQFIFDAVNAPVKKPSLRERLNKRVSFLTGTAAIAFGAVFGGAVGAGVGVGAYSLIQTPAPVVVNNADSVTWVTGAASTAQPSVVTISVSSGSSGGNGSGEFLTADGYILTNTHVVTLDGSTASPVIEVKTYDGHVYQAKLIGTDPTNDLAVIKVDANVQFRPITFADSDKVNVGDNVVAIGAPLGLSNTVTKGIVSALNRTIQVSSSAAPDNSLGGGLQFWNNNSGKPAVNLDVIQTDAAINPGNSGGALVNDKGQLIGVNVAIASAGSSGSGSIGVGFAIPSNVAKRIAAEIMKTGSASHGLLGAGVVDATSSKNAASFTTGAEVKEVTANGAAAKAGVKVGDVIVKLGDKAVSSASELMAAVRQLPAGSKTLIEVVRGSSNLTLQVTLGDASQLK
ncbi:MAG: S1C family serine protease [Micrococcales bacterium]